MSDDILIGSQNCPQVALRMIQTEWAQGLSPEGHHTGGEVTLTSSRLQRQRDPYQTDTTNPRKSCAHNVKRLCLVSLLLSFRHEKPSDESNAPEHLCFIRPTSLM